MVENTEEPVIVDVEDTKTTFEEHKIQTAPEARPYAQLAPQSQPSVIIADSSREEKQCKN